MAIKNTPYLEYQPAVFTVLFVFLFALSDEVHQYIVPGRSFQLFDIVIDSFSSFVIISTKMITSK